MDWWNYKIENLSEEERIKALEEEAHKEGFGSWHDLVTYFIKHGIMPLSLIRYEFELIKTEEKVNGNEG